MKLEKFFRSHPVFTLDEFKQFVASYKKVGPRDCESLLTYHKRIGRVVSVRKGLLAVVPFDFEPSSYLVDGFLLASKMTLDAVLAYHTALEFHGHAYSMNYYYHYLSMKPASPLIFNNNRILGTKFPITLIKNEKTNFGVTKSQHLGMQLSVTSLDRTMVDVLDRPGLAGGWEEIWRSLESAGNFNLDQVVEYTMLLENATTAAKVGFFLEQHRELFMVDEKYLDLLRKLSPKQPHYMERCKRRSGRLVNGWNLVVPDEIFHKTWEEFK
jgi:predicted transcriptional regulator of viral defense system